MSAALLNTRTTTGPDVIVLNGGYLNPQLQPIELLRSARARRPTC